MKDLVERKKFKKAPKNKNKKLGISKLQISLTIDLLQVKNIEGVFIHSNYFANFRTNKNKFLRYLTNTSKNDSLISGEDVPFGMLRNISKVLAPPM